MSLRLTLICHASTPSTRNAAFPPAFPLDEALEPQGLAKATALAPLFPQGAAAWTSPALRAAQTAAALGLRATADAALADIDLGEWAGRSLAEVEAADPHGLADWMTDVTARPHGGEAIVALIARIAIWLDTIGRGQGSVLAVTHPAVIRAAIIVTLNAPPMAFWRIDVAPLCVARLGGRAGRWTLRSLQAEVPPGSHASGALK